MVNQVIEITVVGKTNAQATVDILLKILSVKLL